MEVAVSQLRARLSEWVERARGGEEVIVTDRGEPVVRLVGIESAPALERLVADGVIGRAGQPRPVARGHRRVSAEGSVSDLISTGRR
jgi:prevent-host-death family protein